MAEVLIVEDDPILAKNLQLNLQLDGYEVLWARSLREARELERTRLLDLIVLDLNLPDGHGFELLAQAKKNPRQTPVIVLTALTDEDTVVEGLERGAKDYMRKPFGYRELLVRMKAILREPIFRDEQIRYGDLIVFPQNRSVKFRDVSITLNRREFDVFLALIERPETIVSRRQILDRLDSGGEIFDRTIDSHVSNIRTAFKKAGVAGIKLSAVYGIGYRLEKS